METETEVEAEVETDAETEVETDAETEPNMEIQRQTDRKEIMENYHCSLNIISFS